MAPRRSGRIEIGFAELIGISAATLATLVFVFVMGIYVGRELAAEHAPVDSRVARVPIGESAPRPLGENAPWGGRAPVAGQQTVVEEAKPESRMPDPILAGGVVAKPPTGTDTNPASPKASDANRVRALPGRGRARQAHRISAPNPRSPSPRAIIAQPSAIEEAGAPGGCRYTDRASHSFGRCLQCAGFGQS